MYYIDRMFYAHFRAGACIRSCIWFSLLRLTRYLTQAGTQRRVHFGIERLYKFAPSSLSPCRAALEQIHAPRPLCQVGCHSAFSPLNAGTGAFAGLCAGLLACLFGSKAQPPASGGGGGWGARAKVLTACFMPFIAGAKSAC